MSEIEVKQKGSLFNVINDLNTILSDYVNVLNSAEILREEEDIKSDMNTALAAIKKLNDSLQDTPWQSKNGFIILNQDQYNLLYEIMHPRRSGKVSWNFDEEYKKTQCERDQFREKYHPDSIAPLYEEKSILVEYSVVENILRIFRKLNQKEKSNFSHKYGAFVKNLESLYKFFHFFIHLKEPICDLYPAEEGYSFFNKKNSTLASFYFSKFLWIKEKFERVTSCRYISSEQEGLLKKFSEKMFYYVKCAADLGYPKAVEILGIYFLIGEFDSIPKNCCKHLLQREPIDPAKAIKLLKRSSKKSKLSSNELGKYYEKVGDLKEASKYYLQAVANGSENEAPDALMRLLKDLNDEKIKGIITKEIYNKMDLKDKKNTFGLMFLYMTGNNYKDKFSSFKEFKSHFEFSENLANNISLVILRKTE